MDAIYKQQKSSLKKSFIVAAVAILVLGTAAFYIQSGYTGFATFSGKDRVNYIKPTVCPEQVCNTDSLRTWTSDLGLDLSIYSSDSAAVPLAIIFKDSNALSINTVSKKAFTNDLCVVVNQSSACRAFEGSIQKNDAVILNAFTSLLSVNDVRLKLIAINLKQALGDKVNIVPRFIILSDLSDPKSVNQAEVQEVTRQLCILQTQPNNWVPYTTCIDNALLSSQWTQDTWQACAQTASIDVNSVSSCIQEKGSQLVINEQNTVRQLQLSTTPVLFINNDVYTSKFTYDAVKKTICMYFSQKPENC